MVETKNIELTLDEILFILDILQIRIQNYMGDKTDSEVKELVEIMKKFIL